MNQNVNERARQVIAAAQYEALSFNHSYIGTEHLLLALMRAEFRETAGVLNAFGVDASQVRQQVVQLVQRGHGATSAFEVPLTPRARLALEIAAEEARDANQKEVDPAHVLLGLMREPEGVAGKVLLGLGLNLNEVREAVLKIRHAQMKLVERTVRPIHASLAKKRKMREELLAHLTGIYEEELARAVNPTAALRAAAERFGDPATLAGEFNGSLPWTERANYLFSRSLGWTPPETAAHYNLRFAAGMTAFVTVFLICCLLHAGVFLKDGWSTTLILTRPLVVVLPFLFLDSFLFGLLYFKLRDAMFGAPWAQKSLRGAAIYLSLIALVAYASAVAFTTAVNSNPAHPASFAYVSLAAVALAVIGFPLVAWVNGRSQISDAVWASLDVRTSAGEIAS
jgi:Clp amino terminal domain, pathogenicity island component